MDTSLGFFANTETLPTPHETKPKAMTPQTADSFPNENPIHDFSIEGANLFTDIQFKLNVPEEDFEPELQIFSPFPETEIQRKKNFNFNVLLCIKSADSELISFDKTVESFQEKKDKCRLIFAKQHEKKNIKLSTPYNFELFLRESGGFTQKIWDCEYTFNEKIKSRNFKLQNEDFRLSFEIENFKISFIKLLGLEMPLDTIDNFFAYRGQLLSKSPLLNQIKFLHELRGIYHQLSQQNMGSRILQKLIQKASIEEIREMATQLKHQFPNMILDNYGNYVIQKIFSYSTSELRKTFLQWIEKDFIKILMSKAGTHSLQSIISLIDENSLMKVYDFIKNHEVELCSNEFGTHFMQKLVQIHINYQFIYKILGSFVQVAHSKFGIVVLKKIMKLTSIDYNIRCYMLQYCQTYFNQIYDNEFGHYIIEELFLYYNEYELQHVLNHISTYAVIISQNVFSSNIIRKALQIFSQNWESQMIWELIKDEGDGVKQLMETNPGSFVLHRVLESKSHNINKTCLIDIMKKSVEGLKSYEKRNKWKMFFN